MTKYKKCNVISFLCFLLNCSAIWLSGFRGIAAFAPAAFLGTMIGVIAATVTGIDSLDISERKKVLLIALRLFEYALAFTGYIVILAVIFIRI